MPVVVRAAAVLMVVIGAVTLLGSIVIATVIATVPVEMLEEAGALENAPPDMNPQTLIAFAATCIGVCGGVFGFLYLVLAPFVWRGGRGSIFASALVAGGSVALMVLAAVGSLVQGGPGALPGAAVYFVAAIVLGCLLVLLVRSLGALRQRQLQAMAAYQIGWQGYYTLPPPGGSEGGPPATGQSSREPPS